MIKHSEFDFAYDYLRFDTTWLFEWDAANILSTTRTFYPFTEEGESKTWYFKGNAANVKGHNEFMWDPNSPVFEYQADNVRGWDASHPNNLTRYLSPGSSYIKLSNTIETVVIDNIPPEFVSDKGTEYVWIANVAGTDKGGIKEKRHCSFVFRDQAGLDFKQFAIFIGNPPSADQLNDAAKNKQIINREDQKCVYYFSRKYDQILVNNNLIDFDSLKIKSDGYHTYKIEFDLLYGMTDEEIKKLNDIGLQLVVWDIAGNESVYVFGKCSLDPSYPEHSDGVPGKLKGRRWVLIDSISDLSDVDNLVIKCYDHDPANQIVNENQKGSVWVSVYNPNPEFRLLDAVVQLATDSIGRIDMTTYDDSRYCPYPDNIDDPRNEGLIKFKIVDIINYGSVNIETWLETGNPTFDTMLKMSTLATLSCGPWIIKDTEGRVYDIKRYVPTYLKSTDFYSFIEFFELYLNTLYTDLTKGTNISILEKIAKIGNFNDIDRLEHALVWHFAKSFGAEYDIDLDTMLNLNLGFVNYTKDNNGNGSGCIINSRNENDVIDILKYALKNLPMYNQVKGSEKGIVMALKMFSLSCKVINIWCKMAPTVEEHPDFVEEDRMYDFTSYFLTSRFNIELNSLTVDFPTFNDNIDSFIKFVKSVKPLIRILNLIKYTIIFEYDYYWLVNDYVHDDMEGKAECCYRYSLTWDKDSINEMIEHSKVNWNVMHADRIWFNYNVDECTVVPYKNGSPVGADDTDISDPPDISSLYTFFASYIANSNGKMSFRYHDDIKFDYELTIWEKSSGKVLFKSNVSHSETLDFVKIFTLSEVKTQMLETGFYLYPTTGELATYLADFVKPTYHLNNIVRDKIKGEELEKLVDEYIKDHENEYSKSDLMWAMTDYDLPPDPEKPTQNQPTIKMVIEHVPGTEIYRSIIP